MIFNLTECQLDADTIALLKNGPKFTPSPQYYSDDDFRADTRTLSRTIKFAYFYSNYTTQSPNESLIKLPSKKAPPKTRDNDLNLLCQQLENSKPIRNKKGPKNMARPLYTALNSLLDSELIIKEADKGSGIVIMDPSYYNTKIMDVLNDSIYETVNVDCTYILKKVIAFAKLNRNFLTADEYDAITKQECVLAGFNGLPKIHKSEQIKHATKMQVEKSDVVHCPTPSDLKFRPIVSCQQCPTRNLCDFLDKLLRPFVQKVKFRVQDTWEFLQKLPKRMPSDGIAVTADIESLYTNISTEKAVTAIEHYITTYPNLLPARFTKKFVTDILIFCQENLYFSYNNTTYHQKRGTGMGKIYAPSVADLKQGFDEIILEEKIRENFSDEIFQYFLNSYLRYLDDIWLAWRKEWVDKLARLADIMNSIDPNIRYEFVVSLNTDNNSLPYLDVRVIITEGKVITDIFSKATDTYNYVPFNSAHPRHVIRNVPYSLARRIRGIVSDDELLPIRMGEMTRRLKNKKYPSKLIQDAINKSMAIPREEIIKPPDKITSDNETNSNKSVYFVSTFDPNVKHPKLKFEKFVDDFNVSRSNDAEKLHIEYSFRKNPSLKQLLMFRKLPGTKQVYKCSVGCMLCNDYLFTGDELVLKNGIKIRPNSRFECTSRNVIYIIVCLGCLEFYVGETGDMICIRFNVHRNQSKLEWDDAPIKVDPHLRICGKGKYLVFPFYRPQRNSPIYRRCQEDRWIRLLKPKLNFL